MTADTMLAFYSEQFGEIRGMQINGIPWFIGKDIAEALQYSNTQKAIRDHVDDEDKLTERIVLSGQNRNVVLVNESGLYSLILSSRLTTAKLFKHWVTSEVLPSIRKTGAYLTADTLHKAMSNPRELANLLNALADEQEKSKRLEAENAVLSVKSDYCDRILNSGNNVPITQIAKDYGMSAVAFNQMLYGFKIQYPLRGAWVLYAEYAHYGYTQSKTFCIGENKAVMHTYWTQKGRLFLYDFLKAKGIVPLCELT